MSLSFAEKNSLPISVMLGMAPDPTSLANRGPRNPHLIESGNYRVVSLGAVKGLLLVRECFNLLCMIL